MLLESSEVGINFDCKRSFGNFQGLFRLLFNHFSFATCFWQFFSVFCFCSHQLIQVKCISVLTSLQISKKKNNSKKLKFYLSMNNICSCLSNWLNIDMLTLYSVDQRLKFYAHLASLSWHEDSGKNARRREVSWIHWIWFGTLRIEILSCKFLINNNALTISSGLSDTAFNEILNFLEDFSFKAQKFLKSFEEALGNWQFVLKVKQAEGQNL